MPFLGNVQIVAEPQIYQCAEVGCPSSPHHLFRMSGAPGSPIVYVGFCRLHLDTRNRIPAGFVCEEISKDEWLVGEVMDS